MRRRPRSLAKQQRRSGKERQRVRIEDEQAPDEPADNKSKKS
jgi:hypothetical protein